MPRGQAERGRKAGTETQADILRRLHGYRLTTAEILYHMPDHPGILQTYIWQELDLAPRFPALQRFLAFWNRELEGKLHSVRVGSSSLIGPQEWRNAASLRVVH
jgi:uncharacterized protein Usg